MLPHDYRGYDRADPRKPRQQRENEIGEMFQDPGEGHEILLRLCKQYGVDVRKLGRFETARIYPIILNHEYPNG